jgi:hypothetical protein
VSEAAFSYWLLASSSGVRERNATLKCTEIDAESALLLAGRDPLTMPTPLFFEVRPLL